MNFTAIFLKQRRIDALEKENRDIRIKIDQRDEKRMTGEIWA